MSPPDGSINIPSLVWPIEVRYICTVPSPKRLVLGIRMGRRLRYDVDGTDDVDIASFKERELGKIFG